MKTNGTRFILIVVFLQLLVLICSIGASAQPDYDFGTGTLVSGTDRQIGAKYLYTNVKKGVDAFVTITDISTGITIVDMDAGSGYPEAMQPTLNVAANTKGYLEMKFEFLIAGSSTPMIQFEIPATCIDVDGNPTLHEFDEITLGSGGYVDFNMLGGELVVTFKPGWVVGTNIGNTDYPGRDTSARTAMFSVINSNQSEITVRVGANNIGGSSEQRLRSVYFKKFSYDNSYLSKSALLSFRGTEKSNKVELNWELNSDHLLATIQLEKSTNGEYKSIAEYVLNALSLKNSFRYSDTDPLSANTYYRLKLISVNGSVRYSNILAFRNANSNNNSFKVYPSIVQSNVTVQLRADKASTAIFNLVDMSGRLVLRQELTVQEGTNNILVNGFDKLTTGTYIVLVRTGDQLVQQKISKQ